MRTCYDVVLCSWQAVKIQELTDCMPGLMCPSPSVSQTHCDLVPLCPSPTVSQSHGVQSHCFPVPLCPSPIVSQSHYVPAPLCPSPIMSQPLCVPIPLCPVPLCTRPTQSHSLGCDGPWKQLANTIFRKKGQNNGKLVLYFADAFHNGFVVLCVKRKEKLDLAGLWVHHVVGRGERCAHVDTINALQQSKQEKQHQAKIQKVCFNRKNSVRQKYRFVSTGKTASGKNAEGLFQFLKQSCHHGHTSYPCKHEFKKTCMKLRRNSEDTLSQK